VVHKSPSTTLLAVQDLPVVQPPEITERADAARNRQKILCSARRLIEERGLENVSMDDIAQDAGVGKGTLFRRFGDRASLAHALLDATETAFQEELIRGEPPLGPGAPPCERVIAFGEAMIDLCVDRRDLMAEVQAGPRWLRTSIYSGYRAHLSYLVAMAAPEQDAEFVADTLLGVLRADLVNHLVADRGMDTQRLKDGFRALATTLLS
jgi:AcrR family transcriptional regulator